MSTKPGDVIMRRTRNAAILGMLRDARAMVYRDAESFDQAAAVLEHIGQIFMKKVGKGLGDYKDSICTLARRAPRINRRRIEWLFDTVNYARNDSVHAGDYIRHHAIRLVELLLVLEEAIAMSATLASDLMVQNPVTAELWHNIASVRRAMLTNSFSYLPIKDAAGQWNLVSDLAVVDYLRKKPGDRNHKLGMELGDLIVRKELALTPCRDYRRNTKISELLSELQNQPVLITERQGEEDQLYGILTTFDLL